MKKFLIVGGGGRESAFAKKLMQDVSVYAIMPHNNPSIIDCVKKSAGKFCVADTNNPKIVTEFAIKNNIDYAFVSADDPLANGVVDELLKNNIKAIGGTKAAARIEWDKVYSINMVNNICPSFVPMYRIIANIKDLRQAIQEFIDKDLQIVVKPQGLTGGKGVKVMPEHLSSYQDCIDYALELLEAKPQEQILLMEKLEGIEFTIMGLTDGENLVLSPASYDYPFRFEGDIGAGTGGMGCFTGSNQSLPFMTDKDLTDCKHIMQKVISQMQAAGLAFNGVLNGGFFKTKNGIKFMEFNGRFGDPEGLNVLAVLTSSFSKLLEDIWHKELSKQSVVFSNKASVVKYLVAKEYPNPSTKSSVIKIEKQQLDNHGVDVLYASCTKNQDGSYQTLKKSRALAFIATADNIVEASDMLNYAIDNYVLSDLEYRRDIGSQESLDKLCEKLVK